MGRGIDCEVAAGRSTNVRPDFSAILTATLTLLGLMIGFSFSMAVSRYDQRKDYEEAEANAIATGTAYPAGRSSADRCRSRNAHTVGGLS